jgi:hypothetical protein
VEVACDTKCCNALQWSRWEPPVADACQIAAAVLVCGDVMQRAYMVPTKRSSQRSCKA